MLCVGWIGWNIVFPRWKWFIKLCVMFFFSGNGVVIHLPGLFEETEKNLKKGKGEKILSSDS